MRSWPYPSFPQLTPAAPGTLFLFDHAAGTVKPLAPPRDKDTTVGMYVCGITPYDAAHLGHAATYVIFDVLHRFLLDQGFKVHFVENVTDVDDPLFERADRDHVDWKDLGDEQVALFRDDMAALDVIPPHDFVAVTDSVGEVIDLVSRLKEAGATYEVTDPETGAVDVYARVDATKQFGYVSRYDQQTMLKFFQERGGDPEREGKENPLDALVWRGKRPGEPSWESPFGVGRPGWHIECAAIAEKYLGHEFLIQGGGSDLIFPHHEYTAAHIEAANHSFPMAQWYTHGAMIGLEGTKMSKSLGNLVFVHKLLDDGYSPADIRLSLLAGHYRTDRDFTYRLIDEQKTRVNAWQQAVAAETNDAVAHLVIAALRTALGSDLNTPVAIAVLDAWAQTHTDNTAASTSDDAQLADLPPIIVDGREVAPADFLHDFRASLTRLGNRDADVNPAAGGCISDSVTTLLGVDLVASHSSNS